ncbi:hypothetical protein M2390_002937 [Mycetocola sp. BIGb0189]|uniref:hypothetical protein n=1 Tax=Mycetocola sp. BIGb0189 TaxID=2940604 RepID=UPI002166EC6C|nr:hypothetical protein [Mycetocola sp. BIGb0189]MCS4277728.1 hypothetical protein [Mycetocola sp. BIGb0189]
MERERELDHKPSGRTALVVLVTEPDPVSRMPKSRAISGVWADTGSPVDLADLPGFTIGWD